MLIIFLSEKLLPHRLLLKLDAGKSPGHTHRDYCGMGIEKDNAGRYLYGELYDGDITAPAIFESRASFINWLARQSTATLERLDDVNSFFHSHQVITHGKEYFHSFNNNFHEKDHLKPGRYP